MKIVNLAVKIIEQIRMPVIMYKPILSLLESRGFVTSAQIILTLQIPFCALFYNYSNIYLSMFFISDCMANLSFQLKYLPGVLFRQCLTQFLCFMNTGLGLTLCSVYPLLCSFQSL